MRQVGIVGVGPRGLSVLERIVENVRVRTDMRVVLHLFEPNRFGSGAVWRTDQSPHLLMNVIASQITGFSDETVKIEGPVSPGPSLHAWSIKVAAGEIDVMYPEEVLREAAAVDADTYCRRSFYGHYLEWAYREILQKRPAHVTVHEHRCRAVAVADSANGSQVITSEDGSTVEVDHLVLAVGHSTVRLDAEGEAFRQAAATRHCTYIPPTNAADADLDGIEPGADVLMRGLGLSYFDYMSLLTSGRGGVFTREDGRLRYTPSGKEPHIVCGSRRGVPSHARADNEKGDGRYNPHFFTLSKITALRREVSRTGALSFRRDCWPLISKEVESVYYSRVVADLAGEDAARDFWELYTWAPWESEEERIIRRKFDIDSSYTWDWKKIAQPWTDEDVRTTEAWRSFMRSYLIADFAEAQRGNVSSPLKAAVDAIRDIRNEMRFAINGGGLEGSSYQHDVVGSFNSLHSFLSLGPPWSRTEELVALLDAGIVDVAGPAFRVDFNLEQGLFVGRSLMPGELYRGRTLIDAWLPHVDLSNSTNCVLADLRDKKKLTQFSLPTARSEKYVTGGVSVTGRPFRAVHPDGTIHPKRYVFGVPTEGFNWITETGIRPYVNSVTVGDSDAIARSVLGFST